MDEPAALFGSELRRRRQDAGWSLAKLAAHVHYSRGHLSKIENGAKPAHPELARICDAALRADGALTDLVPNRDSTEPLPERLPNAETWVLEMAGDGVNRMQMPDRRRVLAAGAASVVGFHFGGPTAFAARRAEAPVDSFRGLFEQFRTLGQNAGPSVLLPVLTAQTHTIRQLAGRAASGTRGELLVMAARFAEYAGWMAQEAGDDAAALWWTDRAVEMAEAGGDQDLATYALVRRALVTLYRGDAEQTIELAQQAQRGAAPPRIIGLAAQREAQGHALAGDHGRCMRSLDRARIYLERADRERSAPVLGTAHVSDPAAMAAGWCLHDLGHAGQAAELLDHEVAGVASTASRARARYGVRRALAHVAAGEVEHACAITEELLSAVDVVDSATIAHDLRRLSRNLSRFRAVPAVRELAPRLVTSLSGAGS